LDHALVRRRDPIDPASPSVAELVADGVLDTELAALLWLLLEGRVPLVVASRAEARDRRQVLHALMELLPPDVRRRPVDDGLDREDPGATYLVLDDLIPDPPTAAGARRARTAVQSLQRGFGLGTTVRADPLEDVFAVLQAPPLALHDDAIRGLGVMLILRGTPSRLVAAHYLRPVERDGHGHLQRRPPAVLATWDPTSDGFEHFAWGVTPELAVRVGRTQADFERRQAGRARFLGRLAEAAPATPVGGLARALQDFRSTEEVAATPLAALAAHDHQHRH
jgi:hypothetical protein